MRNDELVDLIWSKYKYDLPDLTKSTVDAIVDDIMTALGMSPLTKKPATGKRRR